MRDSDPTCSTACWYHDPDLRIEEHYTDTAGFTDHVFALMHLLGFASPRAFATWRHQALHPEGRCHLRGSRPMISGTLNIKATPAPIGMKSCGWPPIKQGTATAR